MQVIPQQIQDQIEKIQQPKTKLPPSLHTTRPKQKEILEVIQPRMVSAFNTFKPPMVLLESELHISPRPPQAPRPQTTNKLVEGKRNESQSLSQRSSMIGKSGSKIFESPSKMSNQSLTMGSCNGSKALVNKVY